MTANFQNRLDAFLSGECPPAAFVKELAQFSRASSSSSWESLALLDQYHRRGKLSGDLFRAFRRQIEFDVLGEADPVNIQASNDASVLAETSPYPVVVETDEVQELRAALAREHEKAERYQKRIEVLLEYSHQQRAATAEARRSRRWLPEWPSIPGLVATARRSYLRSREWSSLAAAHRSYHHAHGWPSLAMLMSAALVIAGSAPEMRVEPVAIEAPSAPPPVVAELAPPPEPTIVEPETITLSSERYVVFPGGTTATIKVDRAGGAGGPVSFRWWTESSTAKAGKDYAFAKPKTVELGAGEGSVELSVPILPNPQRKHTELFYVVIGSPSENAELGPTRRATVFIMRPGKQST